jgi:hypothetical protein
VSDDLREAFDKLSGDLREAFGAVRASVEGIDRRLAEVERRLDRGRRSRSRPPSQPQLRVVQPDEVRDERSARSITAAILAGASERQRLRTGLSHRDVRDQLRVRKDAIGTLGYNLMLVFAAAQPTRDKQVTYAACAIGELTLAFEDRDKKMKKVQPRESV